MSANWPCLQCGRWNVPSAPRCTACRTLRPKVGGLTQDERKALNSPELRERERASYRAWAVRRREPDRRNTAELLVTETGWMR